MNLDCMVQIYKRHKKYKVHTNEHKSQKQYAHQLFQSWRGEGGGRGGGGIKTIKFIASAIRSTSLLLYIGHFNFYPFAGFELGLEYVDLALLSTFRVLDESLRWLIANKKFDQARQVVRNACKWNKKDYDEVVNAGGVLDETVDKDLKQSLTDGDGGIKYAEYVTTAVVHQDEYRDKTKLKQEETDRQDGLLNEGNVQETNVQKYTAIDICRYPRILRVSLIIWFTW